MGSTCLGPYGLYTSFTDSTRASHGPNADPNGNIFSPSLAKQLLTSLVLLRLLLLFLLLLCCFARRHIASSGMLWGTVGPGHHIASSGHLGCAWGRGHWLGKELGTSVRSFGFCHIGGLGTLMRSLTFPLNKPFNVLGFTLWGQWTFRVDLGTLVGAN